MLGRTFKACCRVIDEISIGLATFIFCNEVATVAFGKNIEVQKIATNYVN